MKTTKKAVKHIKAFLGFADTGNFFDLPEEKKDAIIQNAAMKARKDQEALLKRYAKMYSR